MRPEDALRRRGIEMRVMGESLPWKRCTPEENARLKAACSTFHVRLTGVEKDGTPFDVIKKVTAQHPETAIGVLTVQAVMDYGARIDSAVVVRSDPPDKQE